MENNKLLSIADQVSLRNILIRLKSHLFYSLYLSLTNKIFKKYLVLFRNSRITTNLIEIKNLSFILEKLCINKDLILFNFRDKFLEFKEIFIWTNVLQIFIAVLLTSLFLKVINIAEIEGEWWVCWFSYQS